MTNHFSEPLLRRSPSMTHQSSSESLVSLDSFVHLIASNSESHTSSTSDYMRETTSSSWRQGIRSPAESLASQYRNPNIQHFMFTHKSVKTADEPAPTYNAPPSFAPSTRSPAFAKRWESVNVCAVRQAPHFSPVPIISIAESGSSS